MAIITEEKQSGTGLIGIVIWLIILVLIGVGAYYIFFKLPVGGGVDTLVKPDSFKKAEAASKIDLNAATVIEQLNKLTDYKSWKEPDSWGRKNPFLAL